MATILRHFVGTIGNVFPDYKFLELGGIPYILYGLYKAWIKINGFCARSYQTGISMVDTASKICAH